MKNSPLKILKGKDKQSNNDERKVLSIQSLHGTFSFFNKKEPEISDDYNSDAENKVNNEDDKIDMDEDLMDFTLEKNVYDFENCRNFNETDLNSLGIDLSQRDPYINDLKSLVRALPFGYKSYYPIPEHYPKCNIGDDISNFMEFATDECLMFLFYSCVNKTHQMTAYNELNKRGFKYDRQENVFRREDTYFDPDSWILRVKESQEI